MSELEKIGRFDVLERIGVGSFSVVYRGQDSFSKLPVAIKICIAHDENLRTGFLRLAEISGRLRHPNIVSVLEFGSGDDKPYLVEEYIPSEHLGWRIEGDQPIPLATRLDYLRQIAEGLEYAHGQGVIHRHLAPRSIRILGERQAKITDFGIAQLSNAMARLTDPDGSSRTDGYIAPEQALGLRADGRTDIFSFGALAYELLTYRKPFSANTLPDLFEQVLKGTGPADQDFSGLSTGMANLIRRCLRRDPMERFPTMTALLKNLRPMVAQEGHGNGQSATTTPEDTQEVPPEAVAHARDPGSDELKTAYILDPPKTGAQAAAQAEEKKAGEDPGDHTIYAGTVLSVPPPDDPGDETILSELPPEPPPSPPAAKAPEAEEAPKPAARPTPPPAEPPDQERSNGTGWTRAAIIVALLVVAFLGFRFLRSSSPPEPPPAVVQPRPVPAPVTAAPIRLQGSLVVDARPWGQVLRLLRPDGSAAAPPGDFTPLHLSLEPGTYFVELAHPDAEEPQVCEVEVIANASARCWVEFTATTPTEYFKRAGWWR